MLQATVTTPQVQVCCKLPLQSKKVPLLFYKHRTIGIIHKNWNLESNLPLFSHELQMPTNQQQVFIAVGAHGPTRILDGSTFFKETGMYMQNIKKNLQLGVTLAQFSKISICKQLHQMLNITSLALILLTSQSKHAICMRI